MNCRIAIFLSTVFSVLLTPVLSDADSLRVEAEHARILVGTAARPAQLSEPAYSAILSREFSLLEPEDALKWEILRPDPQSFDFSQADQLVAFALRHNMKIRGHTLVWHRQNPDWLADGRFTSAQLSQFLETHIKTVVAHYRGKIFAWDVINEGLDESVPGKLRSTVWYNQPGIGFAQQGSAYIAQCFRWAHEADPAALLFYNEADADEVNAKSDAMYAMLTDFLRQGIPIHGVGLQMHLSTLHPDLASISANIRRLAALGLQVHITELDIGLPVDANGNASPEDLRTQANLYRQIAALCLSHPGCTAIQTWGFSDKYSWIGSHSRKTRGAALLFDRNYHPKPAYHALREALAQPR